MQRPRSRRYSILKPELLSLMIELDGAGQPIPGDILDISRGGMKLAITTPIAGQPAFRATISCSSLELQVDLEAQAHWIRPLQESAWLIGCSVNPPLPEDFLTVLLDEGVLERRAFPRYPVNADVVIEWELGKAGAEGQLRDLSKEGFCVFLAEKGKLGTRALVRLVEHGAASQVMAQMQWQAKTADGYLIGCEFRDDQAYYKWQSLLDTGQTLEVPRTRRRRGMTIKRLVALILFLCMVIAGSAAAWKFIPREQWQQWLALIGIKM